MANAANNIDYSPIVLECCRERDEVASVGYYRLARETINRLDTLTERAREGKDLYHGKEFSSYVQWSGIAGLLEGHQSDGPLKIDPGEIKKKTELLASIVHEQFKNNCKVTTFELSEIQHIRHSLDLIAARVSMISVPEADPITNLMAV